MTLVYKRITSSISGLKSESWMELLPLQLLLLLLSILKNKSWVACWERFPPPANFKMICGELYWSSWTSAHWAVPISWGKGWNTNSLSSSFLLFPDDVRWWWWGSLWTSQQSGWVVTVLFAVRKGIVTARCWRVELAAMILGSAVLVIRLHHSLHSSKFSIDLNAKVEDCEASWGPRGESMNTGEK